jgi:hypothetical protein
MAPRGLKSSKYAHWNISKDGWGWPQPFNNLTAARTQYADLRMTDASIDVELAAVLE